MSDFAQIPLLIDIAGLVMAALSFAILFASSRRAPIVFKPVIRFFVVGMALMVIAFLWSILAAVIPDIGGAPVDHHPLISLGLLMFFLGAWKLLHME